MNNLLISPSGSDMYAKLNSQLPPLGLGYIAAVICEKGHYAKILDLGLKGKTLSQELVDWAYIVGVSADTTQFSILTPFPGTALYEDVKRENFILHQNWELYDALHPVIRLDHLTPTQLSKLLLKAYQKVYLNPARLFKISIKRTKRNKTKSKTFLEKRKTLIKALYFFRTFRHQISDGLNREEIYY